MSPRSAASVGLADWYPEVDCGRFDAGI